MNVRSFVHELLFYYDKIKQQTHIYIYIITFVKSLESYVSPSPSHNNVMSLELNIEKRRQTLKDDQ